MNVTTTTAAIISSELNPMLLGMVDALVDS